MTMTVVFAISAMVAGMASWLLPQFVGLLGFTLMAIYLGLGVIAAVAGLLASRPPA